MEQLKTKTNDFKMTDRRSVARKLKQMRRDALIDDLIGVFSLLALVALIILVVLNADLIDAWRFGS